jgi:hypothetical protein
LRTALDALDHERHSEGNDRTLDVRTAGCCFNVHSSPPIGDRAVFVRAFSTGFPISGWAGALARGEIRALTDLVERFLSSVPADAQRRFTTMRQT